VVVEEKPQTPVDPAPEPAPPSVAPGKQHGLNDAHILAQVEKRFCKLRALQNEKLYVAPSPFNPSITARLIVCLSNMCRACCVVCAVYAVCVHRALEAKIRDLEEKLRTAWTDERRREHERELLERLATAEKELELVSARFRVIEDSMLRCTLPTPLTLPSFCRLPH
jgi:hypothetical protein